MNHMKHESCSGWILATTFSWICTSLLFAITVIGDGDLHSLSLCHSSAASSRCLRCSQSGIT